MSLFLDKNYISTKYDTKYPMDCLVHTYNKKYFNNQEETLDMLMKKVLLPGEVAFGYYYDENTSYGTNAIFAVGPLSNGAGNIIFKNSNDIDNLIKDLSTYITEEKENIDLYLQNAIDNIDELINNANNYLQNIQSNIDNIISDSSDLIQQLHIYNTSINEILTFNNEIQDNLDDILILLHDRIEDVSNYIITLINQSFTGENKNTSLYYIINEFKQDIQDKTQNLDLINSSINNLYKKFNYFVEHDFNSQKNIVQNLLRRIGILEHFMYHILEIPEDQAEYSIMDIINIINSSTYGSRLTIHDLNTLNTL